MLKRLPTRIELKVEDVAEYVDFKAKKAREAAAAAAAAAGGGTEYSAVGPRSVRRTDSRIASREERIGLP